VATDKQGIDASCIVRASTIHYWGRRIVSYRIIVELNKEEKSV
jgi:hypothetical protein